MKRSEMVLKLHRFYNIRHCMVEGKNLTVSEFCDEIIQIVEHNGMLPPDTKLAGEYNLDCQWEDE